MKHKEELLADFVANSLSKEQIVELQLAFENDPILKNEFLEARVIYEQLLESKIVEISEENDKAFYDFIAKETQENEGSKSIEKTPFFFSQYFKYAAGFAGLLISFFIGRMSIQETPMLASTTPKKVVEKLVEKRIEVPVYKVDTQYIVQIKEVYKKPESSPEILNEIVKLKEEMQVTKDLLVISMLQKNSPSDRIQAVNYSMNIANPEPEVIAALINTLDYDRNVNVRLAVSEAMNRFGNDPKVRMALINSLIKQESPELQLSLIDLLTNFKETKALPVFKLLANNTETTEFVRKKAEQAAQYLTL